MSRSSVEARRAARSANAPAPAQAAQITSRFALSSGGSVSSADSISADWCVYSSLKAMMCVNSLVMSLIRSSKLWLELALGVAHDPSASFQQLTASDFPGK